MSNFTLTKTDEFFIFQPTSPSITEFRILQVTDQHLPHIGRADRRELKEIAAMAVQYKADLVACTGDLFGHNSSILIKNVLRSFDKIVGSVCPWTFAWGNHDQENFWKTNYTTHLDTFEKLLEHLPHCVYRQTRKYFEQCVDPPLENDLDELLAVNGVKEGKLKWNQYDGFYGGNFHIIVQDPTNTHPAWNLFVLNSRRWAHIPPKVLTWMQNRLQTQDFAIPTLLFYHVPNYEYHLLWESGQAHGVKKENVCFERDRGRIHTFLKELPSIKGVFVGHDHVNDYSGTMDNIVYAYGRKTGMNAYGTSRDEVTMDINIRKVKIGAKLIILSLDNDLPIQNAWDHYTVFPDGTTWRPD
jgi:3',5'-cyclic AMP phosphodiesterase CpdA